MIPAFVHGPIAPVFTAFREDGALDDDGQRRLLDYLLESEAISAYFVRSGLGQMYAFEYEDVEQIARTVCGHLAGKAPVLVGATGVWDRNRAKRPDPEVFVQQAVALTRYAQDQGAAGVVHTLPEAIAPAEGETPADVTLRYFEAVCAATDLPVFIYQPPGTDPAYVVTVDLARQLAAMPQLKGIKASTADAEYILDLTWAAAGLDFAYIVGAETAFYAGLCSGARACIGQGATINPQILKAVQDCFEQEDFKGAIEAQRSVNLLVQTVSNCTEFFKRYVSEQGYAVPPYRREMAANPYAEADPEPVTAAQYAAYKAVLEAELARYM